MYGGIEITRARVLDAPLHRLLQRSWHSDVALEEPEGRAAVSGGVTRRAQQLLRRTDVADDARQLPQPFARLHHPRDGHAPALACGAEEDHLLDVIRRVGEQGGHGGAI